MGFFYFSSSHYAGSESAMLQGVVRISVGKLEVWSSLFKKKNYCKFVIRYVRACYVASVVSDSL